MTVKARTPEQEAAFTRMVHELGKRFSVLECMGIMGYYRQYQDRDGLTELAAIERVRERFLLHDTSGYPKLDRVVEQDADGTTRELSTGLPAKL